MTLNTPCNFISPCLCISYSSAWRAPTSFLISSSHCQIPAHSSSLAQLSPTETPNQFEGLALHSVIVIAFLHISVSTFHSLLYSLYSVVIVSCELNRNQADSWAFISNMTLPCPSCSINICWIDNLGWTDCVSACLFSLQCLFRSPVHLNSSYGVGKQPFPLALHGQPVQNKRHVLLLFSNGALHQRAWKPSGGAEGKKQL